MACSSHGGPGRDEPFTSDASAAPIHEGLPDTIPPPFTTPFVGLISQPVPFSVEIVKILAARLNRGQEGALLPGQTYAELDLSIQNLDTSDLDYSERSTWDLELSDGTRIPSENPLGVVIAAGYTAKTTLRYPVNDGASLEHSKLILDGDQRGLAEPEFVPLDAKWSSPYPIEVSSLRGKTKISSDGLYELDVVSAALELNDPDKYRTLLGKRFVRLNVIAADNGGLVRLLDEGAFRLIADGLSTAPVNSVSEIFDPHTSKKCPVVFSIDRATQVFDVRFSWNGVEAVYHVDLASESAAPAIDGGTGAPRGTP